MKNENGIEKSAILKGSTKYRDIDTGEFLETFEEGRNLELVSVKMPVLTTIGKNLLEEDIPLNYVGHGTVNNMTRIEKGKTYTYRNNKSLTFDGRIVFRVFDEKGKLLDSSTTPITIVRDLYYNSGVNCYAPNANITNANSCFTSNVDGYIRFGLFAYPEEENRDLCFELQLEEGRVPTSYEPHKSNILTTPEDLELRGIRNVKDELDCLTGEITERIGEIVLNGSEGWKVADTGNINRFYLFPSLNNISNNTSMSTTSIISDKLPTISQNQTNDVGIIHWWNGTNSNINIRSTIKTIAEFKVWLSQNPITVQYPLATESIKTVVLNIQDQDNQPQERMKLFPSGYINTSSSTIPPILELKGITHNNKLNMTTTNGTNNTQLATLDNLVLDGIICRDGTVVRDSYDVESGLYTKRVFRFTIDEEFIERYRNDWRFSSSNICFEYVLGEEKNDFPKSSGQGISNIMQFNSGGDINRTFVSKGSNGGSLYVRLLKEELKSYDVDGLLDWIKRNGAIEVAYEMAEPQIIHMQPNMNPYVSTRPYQGSIESQGNILESSFLDYTSEQSIISPKPLGDGDVLRWEQGSQCYVYENEKDYIPLTDYNKPMGTVLDLEEKDGEQFVENLDGGDIIVDVPFKEKAVYERHLVSHEDNVIYPTQDKLDPTGKIEVDYICGATWQNPNDLADIRHVGTLREDGQYDVTIRRSGDDEIRLMDGTTNLSLDGDGINPSEFELTFFNKGGVEVGKYGDTSHKIEECVKDSKLETGTVYGQTLVNTYRITQPMPYTYGNGSYPSSKLTVNLLANKTYLVLLDFSTVDKDGKEVINFFPMSTFTDGTLKQESSFDIKQSGKFIYKYTPTKDVKDYGLVIGQNNFVNNSPTIVLQSAMIIEYQQGMENWDIPYFEGVGSTIVNGFTTTGKNLFGFNDKYEIRNSLTKHEILDMNSIIVSPDTTSPNWINARFYNYYLPHKTTDYFIISTKQEIIDGNPYESFNLYDADDDGKMIRLETWEYNGYKYDLIQFKKDGDRANIRFYCGSNTQMGTIKYSDIQIVKYSQRPSNINVEFEPYKGITYNLPTPITLNKIGDVVDTYDVVSGVETRNVATIVPQVSKQFVQNDNYIGFAYTLTTEEKIESSGTIFETTSINNLGIPFVNKDLVGEGGFTFPDNISEGIGKYNTTELKIILAKSRLNLPEYTQNTVNQWLKENLVCYIKKYTTQTIQHTLIPSTVETMQEPTFILPQPLRSVPNGICDRLYWDENKGHYCIEKRIDVLNLDGTENWSTANSQNNATTIFFETSINSVFNTSRSAYGETIYSDKFKYGYVDSTSNEEIRFNGNFLQIRINKNRLETLDVSGFKKWLRQNNTILYYLPSASQIIDLLHLNRKLTLPTQPDTLPIGYKVENTKANPQLGLTIPYKQLNYPSRPQNIDFKMDIADYVLTWDDVKEARQYNVILNDKVIATVKEPQWNSGEEMYGYILVEAQNELGENLSEELYIKTVPNAPAQLTVAHNPMTNYYDFEISFIKTSAIAEYYTVQYRVDGGEWVIKNIPSGEIDPNSKVLWNFSVYEINKQIEVWATATNEIGTNDILPIATYYMSPTPQWTYRINTKELFVRWIDESPYDTQYKLRYQYKSDGIYRYAYFEGDKQEIGKLYEALIPLAQDEEITIALCVISEKENLYTKPIKASKELDPNIKPPKNFNYRWLARGLIEFYWEDVYNVDVQYEAIVEHRMSGETTWTQDTRLFDSTDVAGTGTIYRLQYQLTDLEEIRVKVRMKWAMNETEWSESLTTVFIPVEGNPPQWIRRTQTKDGLLVEWEAQQYVDSYHVYVMSNGVELQHLETKDNFVLVDIDYSNTIDIEIYEVSRFTGGIEANPSDSMRFRPTMDKQQLIGNFYTPDLLRYELEIDTVQKNQKARTEIHDINTTPSVKSKDPLDISISSPFVITYHPLQLDVHQSGAKAYGQSELHIKTLDVKSRNVVEVLTFERVTDQYGVDFTVYTPSASKYPITLEVNRVRIVCFGDSLTSGHPGFWAETGTGDPQHCYEYWLDRRLKGQYEIINKGYGSDTTDRMLARFDRDVLSNNPQYCIIQGGTNDLYWAMAESMGDQEALNMKLQVMKDNIMEMVKRCWDNNIIPIVGNLIPRTGATGIYKTALYDFNAWIIQWCTQKAGEGYNIFYVDLFNAGKEAVPPTPIEDPTNPGAMNPIYDGDALFDEFGNIIKQGRGIHLNKEGYRIWAEAIPLSIFKTYDSGLRMYKNVQCTDEDDYDDSDKQNPFYTMSVDNVRRSKTKTVVRYVKNIGKTQVLFAMYASDEYNMSIEFIGSNGEKGQYCNGLLAPNMIAKVTMEINLDNKDSKATFNLHLAAREYNQS